MVQVASIIALRAEQMHGECNVNGTVSTHNSFKVERTLSSTPSFGERAIDGRNWTEVSEMIAKVRGGEAPAQYISNSNTSFIIVRIIWNTGSERVERWKVHFPTGEFTLHAIPVASLGELELAGLNGSTIGFEDLGVVTLSAGFFDSCLQEIVDERLVHWLSGDEETTNLARFGNSSWPILGQFGGERGSIRFLHGAGSVVDLQRVGQRFGGWPTIALTLHGLTLNSCCQASRRCDRVGIE